MRSLLIGFLIGVSTIATADPRDWAKRIPCELQTAGIASLPTLEVLQGSSPLIACDQYRSGKALTVTNDVQAVMRFSSSLTNTLWVSVTNQSYYSNSYLIQLPSLGTNATSWVYTILYYKDGAIYWTGTGRLDIKRTDVTGLALTWQQIQGCVTSNDINSAISTHNLATASHPDKVTTNNATYLQTVSLASTALQSFTESDPKWSAVSNTVTAGALAGSTALQSETDTLATVTARGATTTNTVTLKDAIFTDTTPAVPVAGQLWYDDNSLNFKPDSGNTVLQLGEEMVGRYRNQSGATITNGRAVYMSGQVGDNPTIELASAVNASQARAMIGIATEDILHGADGRATSFGLVRGIARSFFDAPSGSDVYLNHIAGNLSTNVSDAYVGKVTRVYGQWLDIFVVPVYDLTRFDYSVITNAPWATSAQLTSHTNATADAHPTSAITGLDSALSNSIPYKPFTGTITPANGTATVVYAHGNMPSLTLDSATVITLEPTSYGTSGVSRVALSLYCGTNSVTLSTNVITYATTPTLSTNQWNTILIRRVSNDAWKGAQL